MMNEISSKGMIRMDDRVTPREKDYLRALAAKQRAYAELPVMQERKELWTRHNAIEGVRPMVVIEEDTFWDDIKPAAHCETPLAREIEDRLSRALFAHEQMDDDKVMPDFYRLEYHIDTLTLGLRQQRTESGQGVGYHIEPVLEDLESDLDQLSPSDFSFDTSTFAQKKEAIERLIGDLLPVRAVNATNYWAFTPLQTVVQLMGMENMFFAMKDTPEAFLRLMELVADSQIALLRYEEHHGLLPLNNGNDYLGSGSFCFSRELPGPDFDGTVRSLHTFGHMNAQEAVGLSPEMFREMILPCYQRVAKEFRLLYYGCCEPVSAFWEDGVETLPNLRKVSVSPWCDEAYMAPRLAQRRILYSRKPSPNFLGVQSAFEEGAFRAHIRATVELTRDCETEYIFRDVYRLHGNVSKLRRAVEIVREETRSR